MAKPPIEMIFDKVEWKALLPQKTEGLYATHEGIMHIGDFSLRVYQLNDGRGVIDQEDLALFFQGETK